MCVSKRKKKPTTCGILVHDVTQGNQSGTCLMMNMTYEGLSYDTFSLRTLEQWGKEMARLPYHKQVLVMRHLKEYLSKEKQNEEAMNECSRLATIIQKESSQVCRVVIQQASCSRCFRECHWRCCHERARFTTLTKRPCPQQCSGRGCSGKPQTSTPADARTTYAI